MTATTNNTNDIGNALRMIEKAEAIGAASIAKLERMTAEDGKDRTKTAKGIRTSLKAAAQTRKILEKIDKRESKTATPDERRSLIRLVSIGKHSGGKIEGAESIDGTCHCDFCEKMAQNPDFICAECYARGEQEQKKTSPQIRHIINAAILSGILFTLADLRLLPISAQRVRFCEDGDTVNETMGRNLLRIAKVNPAAAFGYWYKNRAAIKAAVKAEGKPRNVCFVQSSPIVGEPTDWDGIADAIFTVYINAVEVAEAINRGAIPCNGIKCLICGWRCYKANKKGNGPAHVAELLRPQK